MSLALPRNWDRHHVFSPESVYSRKVRSVENKFRNHCGLVIPTPKVNHDLWNKQGSHPPKPEREQMMDVMDYLDNTPPAVQLADFRLWGVRKAEAYFGAIALQDDNEQSFKARRIQENLQQQIGIFSMQLVEVTIA